MEIKVVDARGLACPLPVVNAKKATAELKQGGKVSVLVDNEIAVQNLQKFAKQKVYECMAKKLAPQEYEVTMIVEVKKSVEETEDVTKVVTEKIDMGVRRSNEDEKTPTCQPDIRKKGMVVVLSGNVCGTGEEKLGKALMKAFVFALTKQDQLPETILCYNTGAYLTCEGADTLEDMKSLEAEGVKILTCGTCLDFYGLKEKLVVGSVTNMYEMVETMEQAQNIISP
ncbi:MAG: sulfurtransferase-like selenium metabolism protein YedF [Lachnospiraceae bacterium]|nr:sulfurtransferase-like selenium metabolism protein YedF [Lachnospiraceae bacterium]